MNIDVFILARLGSSRLPEKHLKLINDKPAIHHLIHRIKKSKKIRKIIICTTELESDDKLVEYLEKEEVEIFRGNNEDVLKRILDAAKFYQTDVIIDVEGDKIYTDPKFIDIVINEFENSQIDYVTGNDSQTKFNPSHGIHGIIPAGFTTKSIEKICQLKTKNNTDTGYKEFFLNNEFKIKYIVPDNIKEIPNGLRLFLDYQVDLDFARVIFKKIGNEFDLKNLLKLLENEPKLLDITKPAVDLWSENYEKTKCS
jgi:spore coat polysaccharide biosynthesis protein SpsF